MSPYGSCELSFNSCVLQLCLPRDNTAHLIGSQGKKQEQRRNDGRFDQHRAICIVAQPLEIVKPWHHATSLTLARSLETSSSLIIPGGQKLLMLVVPSSVMLAAAINRQALVTVAVPLKRMSLLGR